VIAAIWGSQNRQPERQILRVPKPTPTPNFAPVEKIAGYQNRKVLNRYKNLSQTANKVYGWFVVDCTASLCGDDDGFLVAFRITTNIGSILPIWHVSADLQTLSWVNGKAGGETPDLAQKMVPDIPALVDHFERMPGSSAFVLKKTP